MGKKNQLLFFIFDKVIKTKALVPPLRRSQQGSGGGGPPFWTGWGVSPWSPWAQGCEGPRETQAELGEAALMNFLVGKGGVGPLLLGLGDGSPPPSRGWGPADGDRVPSWVGAKRCQGLWVLQGRQEQGLRHNVAWDRPWGTRGSEERAPRSWGSCGGFPTRLVLGALPCCFNSPRAFLEALF